MTSIAERFLGNWETTVAGVFLGVLTAGRFMGLIDEDTYAWLFGIGATVGFWAAKDGKK